MHVEENQKTLPEDFCILVRHTKIGVRRCFWLMKSESRMAQIKAENSYTDYPKVSVSHWSKMDKHREILTQILAQ